MCYRSECRNILFAPVNVAGSHRVRDVSHTFTAQETQERMIHISGSNYARRDIDGLEYVIRIDKMGSQHTCQEMDTHQGVFKTGVKDGRTVTSVLPTNKTCSTCSA